MPAATEARRIPFDEASADLRERFASLRSRAGLSALPVLHDPELGAVSFYACAGEEVVSYAAVVRKRVSHAGETFEVVGLSSVVTDPRFRRRGFGQRVVEAATRWMAQSGADFGIFTCDPPLAEFYARAGAWPVAQNVVLVGSRNDGALRSDTLRKIVLMRLFSDRALAAAPILTHATIDLDLPVGQFL